MMSRRKRRLTNTNKKDAAGCLFGSVCIIAGIVTAVIGYNTWHGLWLLVGIMLVPVGIAFSWSFLYHDDDDYDDGNDDTWWLY